MKTRSFFILMLVFLILQATHAQRQKKSLDLGAEGAFLKAVNLGDQGFLVKTTSAKKGRFYQDWQLRYFSPNLELLWEVSTPKVKGFPDPLIAAPDGSYVYQIEYRRLGGARSGKMHLTQVHKGRVREKWVETRYMKGAERAAFCNEKYLYYLTAGKVGEDNKLYLYKFSHRNLMKNEVILDLPVRDFHKNMTGWRYLNHTNDKVYLFRKVMEEGLTYQVCQLNHEGELQKEVFLSAGLDRRSPRYSRNHKSTYPYSADLGQDPDFEVKAGQEEAAPNFVPRLGALGNIAMDPVRGHYYAYGLSGNGAPQSTGRACSGFFIIKYDLAGNVVWKLEQPASRELLADPYFGNGTPYKREVVFHIGNRGGPVLEILGKDKTYVHHITTSGKLEEEYSRKHHPGYDNSNLRYLSPVRRDSRPGAYITEHYKGRENTYDIQHLGNSASEILLVQDNEQEKLHLLLFK